MRPKLKFINVVGPKEELDRTIETYIINHEIRVEDALAELRSVRGLEKAEKSNVYMQPYQHLQKMLQTTGLDAKDSRRAELKEALETEARLGEAFDKLESQKEELQNEIDDMETLIGKLIPFSALQVDIGVLLRLEFIKFRFGRIPKDGYRLYDGYLKEKFEALFFKSGEDDKFIYGLYFVSPAAEEKVDAVFSSLHFERFFVPAELSGMPAEAVETKRKEIKEKEKMILEIGQAQKDALNQEKDNLCAAYQTVHAACASYDIRKNVAIRKDDYFIIVGWTTPKEAKRLEKEMAHEEHITLVVEDPNEAIASKQPLKKNEITMLSLF